MKYKAIFAASLLVVSSSAYSYEFLIKMDPGTRDVHTSEALHNITDNSVVDKLPTGSTLKGQSLIDGRGNIWQGFHSRENKTVFDGTLTYLHTDNSYLEKSQWDQANYKINIVEVGGEGGFGDRGDKTQLDIDRITRDGQKIDICHHLIQNSDALSYAGMGNLNIELKADDLDNPDIHITRVHSDGGVDGTWKICD